MKQHILFINGDKNELIFFLDALMIMPHHNGFKCTYASSPGQALEMLKYLVPDFIFVDFNLPGMNGLDFMTNITGWPQLKHTKFILYSANINERIRTLADQGVSYLKKAGTLKELAENLSGMLIADLQPAYSLSTLQ